MVSQEQLESSTYHYVNAVDNEPKQNGMFRRYSQTAKRLTSRQQAFIELVAEDDQPK